MNYDSLIDRLIDLAIEEDIATGDISTDAIIPEHADAIAEMTAKADGVISGLEIIRRVYERFDDRLGWEPLVADGDAESDVIASGTRASLDVPTLEGTPGIMEVGITVRPKETSPWAVDFGLKGYVGDRQGVSGNASVVYSF